MYQVSNKLSIFACTFNKILVEVGQVISQSWSGLVDIWLSKDVFGQGFSGHQ